MAGTQGSSADLAAASCQEREHLQPAIARARAQTPTFQPSSPRTAALFSADGRVSAAGLRFGRGRERRGDATRGVSVRPRFGAVNQPQPTSQSGARPALHHLARRYMNTAVTQTAVPLNPGWEAIPQTWGRSPPQSSMREDPKRRRFCVLSRTALSHLISNSF